MNGGIPTLEAVVRDLARTAANKRDAHAARELANRMRKS